MKGKNRNVKINTNIIGAISDIKPITCKVLIYMLVCGMINQEGYFAGNYTSIARDLNLSVKTVSNVIKDLLASYIITKTPIENVYKVNENFITL